MSTSLAAIGTTPSVDSFNKRALLVYLSSLSEEDRTFDNDWREVKKDAISRIKAVNKVFITFKLGKKTTGYFTQVDLSKAGDFSLEEV